jgi:transcriptional regulator with XRE-family HTH domain
MATKEQHQQMPETTACEPQAKTLADLRRLAGLHQSDVAKRMGVNRPRVSQIERDFPNLQYQVVARYLQALGAAAVTIRGTKTLLGDIRADPRSVGAQVNRESRSAFRTSRPTTQTSPEEQPLQGDQPEPGGDDTGRDVDEADPEGDQRDGAQGEQP